MKYQVNWDTYGVMYGKNTTKNLVVHTTPFEYIHAHNSIKYSKIM